MSWKCPICGNEKSSILFNCTDHFVSGEKFDVATCDSCELRFTLEVPDAGNIGKYYEAEDYVSHSNTKKGTLNTLYHYVRNYMLRRKAKWVEKHSGLKQGRLLDIGAGTGFFGHTMHLRGWEASLIEQSEAAREFCLKNFSLQASEDINEFAQAHIQNHSKPYDVITLWHVMEHLPHPNDVMQKALTLLSNRGLLVIAVPNCDSYDARKYKEKWAAYDVPRHLWHFREEQMKTLATNNGFHIDTIKKMPFDAFYVSMLTEKQQGKPLSFLRGAWSGTCGYIASVFNKNRSSSLVYLLRKN